jgi:hypothetical protein
MPSRLLEGEELLLKNRIEYYIENKIPMDKG